jgi:translation initiation factor IF-3
MFRGREQQHPERGRDLLMRLAEDVKELGVIESPPLQDGRNMVMVLGPTKNAGVKREDDAQAEDIQRSEEALQGDGSGEAPAPPAPPDDAPGTPDQESPGEPEARAAGHVGRA